MCWKLFEKTIYLTIFDRTVCKLWSSINDGAIYLFMVTFDIDILLLLVTYLSSFIV